LDHIAFTASDLALMRARLDRSGVKHFERTVYANRIDECASLFFAANKAMI
jgi:hypothetical protein